MTQKRLLSGSILLAVFFTAFTGLSQNLFAWTDTITSGTTRIRAVHITEMRTVVDAKRADYSFSAYSWTDASLTAGSSRVRAVHITDLRTAVDAIRSVYNPLCPSTVTTASGGWTDSSITAGTTRVRAVHITQLRTAIDSIGSCKACAQAVGTCKKCNGASGIINQTAAQDLWSECSASGSPTCGTGLCNGSGACTFNPITCYTDSDSDSQGTGAGGVQCGSCSVGTVSNNNDCCDTDANAKTGQTSYFTTPRTTCGGYDYNCNSTIEIDPTDTPIPSAWGCDIPAFNDCAFHTNYAPTSSDCGSSIQSSVTKNAGSTCSAGTTQCAPTGTITTYVIGCH